MAHQFVIDTVQLPSDTDTATAVLRFLCRQEQWAILQQEAKAWQLPGNSLLRWVMQTRDEQPAVQQQCLLALLSSNTPEQQYDRAPLTTEHAWPQLRQFWLEQGVRAGWLLPKFAEFGWSMWQVLSADGAALLSAVGFAPELGRLANHRWCSVFLLSNGYQHLLLDCAAKRYLNDQLRSQCLFRLSLRISALPGALQSEAKVFGLSELQLFASCLPAPHRQTATVMTDHAAIAENLQFSCAQLSYPQLSALVSEKPWILRYLPMTGVMLQHRLQLTRYQPWLYRQLWPMQQSLAFIQLWLQKHQLQRPFTQAKFFEAALLSAITEGFSTSSVQTKINPLMRRQEAKSVWTAQQECAAADKSFMLADVLELVPLWQGECQKTITPAMLPPLLESLKTLFVMLYRLRPAQLQIILYQCAWLILLVPANRQGRYLEQALRHSPAIAELLMPRLNAAQRWQVLCQAPYLARHGRIILTAKEFHRLVKFYPLLAVDNLAWATDSELARAVAEKPELFKQIPPRLVTAGLLEQMLHLRGTALAEVPLRRRSFALCHLAINQQLAALEFVPDSFDDELVHKPNYWPFYQQSYHWARAHHPELAELFQQKLPSFYQCCLLELIADAASNT